MDSKMILVAIAVIVIAFILYKKFKHVPTDIVVPTPTTLRTDLYYGYFGCLGNQAQETLGQVNLFWENQYEGYEKAAQNIAIANKPTILDVSSQVMTRFADHGKNFRFNQDAEQNLRGLFEYFRARGVLHNIIAVVPIDEPNTNVETEADLQHAIDVIRKVSREYHELENVKLAIIYAAKPTPFPLLDQFDLIGVDDYDSKSEIFVNGTYAELLKTKNKNARTFLLPGGGFGQDPTPFINFAHNNPEVFAVVPFVYFGPMQAADTWVGIGDDKNPLKQAYIDAGKALIGAK